MNTNERFIRRSMWDELVAHLEQPEITMLVGARQVGKTTLLKRLESDIRRKGTHTLWLNLDFEDDYRHVSSQSALLQKIRLELGDHEGLVFIDEIQRKENAGLFLKGIYDQGLPWKFIVSGSGSMELKEKISESLAGRKRMFELSTVSFGEFVDFRTEYRYTGRLRDFFQVETAKTDQLLQEYLLYGGYPRVVLTDTHKEKTAIINEIYRSYLEKDVVSLLRVEKSEIFTKLVRIMASQTGRPVNYSEMASTLGISLATVKNYLWYMEKTYILWKVSPWCTNMRKEITKSPSYYFCDVGLRNFASGAFGVLYAHDAGFVFQNFICVLLKEKYSLADTTVHYWRTKDKAEVDFVVRSGGAVTPFEVKYRSMNRIEIPRALRGFLDRYAPPRAYVLNLRHREHATINNTEVLCLPFWELLFA